MRSVGLFFPSCIIELMNFVTNRSWNLGSARMSRRLTSPLRGMAIRPLAFRAQAGPTTRSAPCAPYPPPEPGASLRSFGSVLRAALPSILDADRVERAANDVVANSREVFHAATADEHDGVLLQVVANPGYVRGDLDAVREPHARDFPEGRVRLLRRGRVDARADTPLLRRPLQRRGGQ